MYSELLPLFGFHARRLFRDQPALCLSGGLTFLAAAFAGLTYWNLIGAVNEAELLSIELRAKERPTVVIDESARFVPPALQPFNSAQVLQGLHQVAKQIEVPLDEVTFSLDDTSTQPFLRYRATLTLTARYVLIRRFIDQVNASLPDITLDAISCTRTDVAATALKCELAISTFYRRREHG